MPHSLALQTAPAIEPVTLAEAKAQLRVDHDEENDLITSLIVAARQWCENFTRRAFVTQVWRQYMDVFPSGSMNGWYRPIVLRKPPLTSTDFSIVYVDTNGSSQTWSSSEYSIDTASEPGRVTPSHGFTYPQTRPQPNAVYVQFKCGYGATAATVPDSIRAAIKMLVGGMYAHREPEVTGTIVANLQFSLESLLWPYRILEAE